ncbi:MAG: M56 family metallopeptidase [Cytophagales bacterium]|nr:M56 family metallopeptidase [Cytophagales bacterium]
MKSEFLLYLLGVSVNLVVFLGFYRLVLYDSTFYALSRVYLLVAPALSLVIPLVRMGRAEPTAPGGVLPGVHWNALPAAVGAVQGQIEEFPGTADYLWIGYWLGCLLFAGVLLVKLSRLAMLIRRSRFEDCQGYRLTRTGGSVPTFSFLHYLFWNDDQSLGKAEAEAVLRHELVHIRERHTLDVLYLEGLRVFLWFNPALFGYARALRELHELKADQRVVAHLGKDAYAHLLKRTVAGRLALSLSHSFHQSFTKRRIQMLYHPASARSRLWTLLLLLPLAGILLAAFAFRQPAGLSPAGDAIAVDTARVVQHAIVIQAGRPGQVVPQADLTKGFSAGEFPESITVQAVPDPDYLKKYPKEKFAVSEFEVFLVQGRRPVKFRAAGGDSVTSIRAEANWVSLAPLKQFAKPGNRLVVEVKQVIRMDANGRLYTLGQVVQSPIHSILITE